MAELTVFVVSFTDRPAFQMCYIDPVTGRRRTKSTGIKDTGHKRDRIAAERVAAKWEADLLAGRYADVSRITWDDFKDRYYGEKLSSLSDGTTQAADTVFGDVERSINPRLLGNMTAEAVSRLQADLRGRGLAEPTIAGRLRHLRAALSWAVGQGMLAKVPRVDMPKRARKQSKAMRGRPITLEEMERMVTVVPLVRKKDPERWQRLLWGLWHSGLRISEALQLSWDEDSDICVWQHGRFPKLRYFAESEKGNRDRLIPITPEFSDFLDETHPDDRHGLVFGIHGNRPGRPLSTKRASRYISAIGRRAGIVVDKQAGKCASAHDLRRSFGTRMAQRVKPATLKLLMRHKSLETTLQHYVLLDADDVGAELWGDRGYIPGYTTESADSRQA